MDYNIHMNKNNHGFTLIELMVTMAVVSIVLLTGIPALNQMTERNRLVTQINSISGSLTLARSEAIRAGTVVTVCATSNATTCNVTTWHSGWMAFTDKDKDAVVDAGTDTIILIHDAFNGDSELRLTLNPSAGVFQFLPDGSSRNAPRSTFILCPKDKVVNNAKAININFIGRASTAQGATPIDAAGSAVTCP